MTLDEAIKHCEEKAREIRQAQEELPPEAKLSKDLLECACEHEQLAEWLKELKAYQDLFTSPEEAENLLEQFMV